MSTLKHIEGRIIVAVDHESKNSHRFSDGTVIRLERDWNNLNRRETQPTNATVISGANIPKGSEILIHHNAPSDTNRIHNYSKLSGKETGSDIKHYSIPEDQCFAWYDGKDWQPIPPFSFALRIFKPYYGVIEGVEPTLLKDTLFVTTGELKNKVVKTIEASDYQIIAQGKNGKEICLIRFRPFGDKKNGREEEAIAILWNETKQVLNDKYLIGYSTTDSQKYSIYG